MEAIFKKDLQSMFNNMTGFILCAFLISVMGIYFTALYLVGGYAELGALFNGTTFTFLVVVPLLTMRGISEERRLKTDQLLLTSPITIAEIVYGKYFALVTVFALPMAITTTLPIIMSMFGNISFIRSYMAIGAFFLLGCAAISIGFFISTLTESVLISGICTFAALLMLYLMPAISSLAPSSALGSAVCFTILFALIGLLFYYLVRNVFIVGAAFIVMAIGTWVVFVLNPIMLQGAFVNLLNSLALFGRYEPFVTGTLDITAIIYFISITAVFLFLTCKSLEKQRW